MPVKWTRPKKAADSKRTTASAPKPEKPKGGKPKGDDKPNGKKAGPCARRAGPWSSRTR